MHVRLIGIHYNGQTGSWRPEYLWEGEIFGVMSYGTWACPELPLYVFAVGSNDAASGYHVYCSNFLFIMETVII